MRALNVDPACYELAEHFMDPSEGWTEEDKRLLASDIQEAVEDFLGAHRQETR